MRRIQVFVEGGGADADQKTRLRGGFSGFFSKAGVRCHVVACGGRDVALKKWQIARFSQPEDLNLLLVDSEGPVGESTPWDHLGKTWSLPDGTEGLCHLMVEVMEAWFLADREVLAANYGKQFGASALPGRQNVEEIPKSDIERSLKRATKRTQKGEYHKIRHASDLLARIDPAKVRDRAPHCKRLLETLAKAQAGA